METKKSLFAFEDYFKENKEKIDTVNDYLDKKSMLSTIKAYDILFKLGFSKAEREIYIKNYKAEKDGYNRYFR